MFKNYFKIAIAVFKRRKFFTFISLFGISFTLTILIVITSFFDHLVSPSYPDVNRDRELFISRMTFQASKEGWTNTSPPSFYFFDHYLSRLKTPVTIALYTGTEHTSAYQQNKKIDLDINYTNTAYWAVYAFDFIEGKPFNGQQLSNADQVAVISEDARTKYFGENSRALGQSIAANNTTYKVVGVVRTAPALNPNCAADLYLPYTLAKRDLKGPSLMGGFSATLLLNDRADIPLIQAEILDIVKKLPRESKEMDLIYCFADTYVTGFTRGFSGNADDPGTRRMLLICVPLVIFFLLLPTINLVNINVSRILERSSEIGVRKAFGASGRTLTIQFIVENLLLTFIGGLLGLIFSAVVIYILNSSALVANLRLQINFTVLLYSLLACLVFGFFSGVYPAWRMSKLNVVTALKANN